MGKTVRLLDGSFYSALKEQGFDANEHKLWTGAANKLHPEMVFNAYKRFLEAGVDVMTTNTYHSLIPLIEQYYPGDEVDEFNKPAVTTLLAAIEKVNTERQITVLGSIGCYGASLRNASEYHGEYVEEPDKMQNFYSAEVAKMERYGLKQLITETVPALAELEVILDVVSRSSSSFVISFSCKDGEHLRHGELFADAVALAAAHPRVIAVGVNCTAAEHMSSLLRCSQNLTQEKDVFVYPNTNTGFSEGLNLVDLPDEQLSNLLKEWISLGATGIGGCCGVSPSLIAKMRQVFDSQ